MLIGRGNIHYISYGKYYATDPNNVVGRPGVIVSSNELNNSSDFVEVVYLTTQPKKSMPTHAEVLCKTPSTALCETIYTVDKGKIGDFIKCCTDEEMKGIERAMLYSLGIEATTESENRSVKFERNFYKRLYEELLNKVTER